MENRKYMELKGLNVPLISGWVGSEVDLQEVWSREGSLTQFLIQGLWLEKCVLCAHVCTCARVCVF